MDTLSPTKNSKTSSSSSSGCSASSSTTDIKNSYKSQRLDNKPAGMRSRSFLHCLSKHLGRHFIHHHAHYHHTVHQNGQTIVYNSQEELRSSSTDSFSLSYERNSRVDGLSQHCNNSNGTGTSSFDISSDERTSRASSTSACSRFSPEQEDIENATPKAYKHSGKHQHIYISTNIYRPSSTFNCHNDLEEDYSESDDSGNSSSEENAENIFNESLNNNKAKCKTENNLSTSAAKGLHMSRISITSSVRSILQHISSVSATSTRSLSCSSTPLKRVWDSKCKKSNSTPNSSISSTSNSQIKSNKSSIKSNNSNTSANNSSQNSKKTEKKQQSILRPPVNYVYMKGMSGLYSRVPRYSVCCPYGTQQWA